MAHSVTLNWVASTTGDPAVSYTISRGVLQQGPFTTVGTATTTTYVDTTVVAGSTYFYEVEGVNSAGQSAPSNEVTVTVPFLIPGAPTGLTAVAA